MCFFIFIELILFLLLLTKPSFNLLILNILCIGVIFSSFAEAEEKKRQSTEKSQNHEEHHNALLNSNKSKKNVE
ncbi:hypothetical protein HO913_03205 [Streptococcus suis]|nr:hypothetical protein [Streptococcus suis]NQP58329.1 hypothetical protein [Streptococcus suis]